MKNIPISQAEILVNNIEVQFDLGFIVAFIFILFILPFFKGKQFSFPTPEIHAQIQFYTCTTEVVMILIIILYIFAFSKQKQMI